MNSLAKKILTSAGLGLASALVISKIREELRYTTLKGKVVLISGGSRGLGLLLAKEYAQAGASIAILARDFYELQAAQNIIQLHAPEALVHSFVCDCKIAKEVNKSVSDILDIFGKIDIVVNNAGVISSSPIENAQEQEFTESMDIHFWAPYHIIEACRPHLKRGARIVNISSIGGLIPIPHRAAYCAGKFALVGYSRTLRAELMHKGIYVTTVSPNVMRTGSIDHATFNGQVKKEYAWFSILASLPLISSSAEKTAKDIVRATRYGKAELTISFSAKLAVILQSQFPGLFSDIISLANLALPEPSAENKQAVVGAQAHSFISPSALTLSSQKAAQRNNEGPSLSQRTHHRH